MLGLMQIMNYMLKIGYSPRTIQDIFEGIECGDNTIPNLLQNLGIELGSQSQVDRTVEKLHLWPSALSVTVLRYEATQELEPDT